jgi:hypothetical protein
LSKQYYCDVDIAHLIAYNEELADRLNNEPAEIIPIVSTLWIPLTMSPDPVPVRERTEIVHAKNPVPIAQCSRYCCGKGTPQSPTFTPLFGLPNYHSRSHRHQRIAYGAHPRNRYRSEHLELQGYVNSHPMSAVRI